MSNKNLLNEAQVRQFMKLASLGPLTPGFVHGLTERGEKAGDEGSKADGKKGDTDYSGGGERKGDKSKTHAGKDLEEGTEEEEDELRTGVTGRLGPKNGTANPGHGRGQGEAADGSLFQEEDELEADLGAADDDMDDAADLEADADEDLGDVEADLGGDEGRMVSVDDFLSALESALESAMGDEVEVDASEMSDEAPEPPPGEEGFVPEGDDVVADMELDDEAELEEGVFGGKSAADKAREKMALGKKGSYAPDPEAGEKDYTPTPEEAAKARAEKRPRRPRIRATDIGGGGGGMRIGGISEGNTDELVERITKRVAARILKSALAKK